VSKSHPTCKSRFPRETFSQTLIDPDTGVLTLKKGEAWLNYYTPALTYLMRCNTDVTSLQSGTAIKAVIAYVTDYITKSLLKTHVMFDTVKTIFARQIENSNDIHSDRFKHASSVITKVVNALTSQSEIGSPMAAMYFLKHPDHYTNQLFVRFYWKQYVYEIRDVYRELEAEKNNAVANIDTSDFQDVRMAISKNNKGIVGIYPMHDYMYRPPKYESICLYDWIQLSIKSRVCVSKKK
jgi:hypothetical protein